jgi:hypothetical protein
MKPGDLIRSTQELQNYMMALIATRDEILDDSSDKTEDSIVYNAIEVITDEATLDTIKHYKPQEGEFQEEALLYDLGKGVYFGYFKEITVSDGIVRLYSW